MYVLYDRGRLPLGTELLRTSEYLYTDIQAFWHDITHLKSWSNTLRHSLVNKYWTQNRLIASQTRNWKLYCFSAHPPYAPSIQSTMQANCHTQKSQTSTHKIVMVHYSPYWDNGGDKIDVAKLSHYHRSFFFLVATITIFMVMFL